MAFVGQVSPLVASDVKMDFPKAPVDNPIGSIFYQKNLLIDSLNVFPELLS